MAQTYLEMIQQYAPDAYSKIAQAAQYTANENYGGKIQDYQAQLLTPLSSDVLNQASKVKFELTPVTTRYVGFDEDGNPAYQRTGGQVIPPEGVKPEYDVSTNSDTFGQRSGFSKNLGIINGVPITANYDNQGNLTGYVGDQSVRTFLDGSHSISGKWDALGNATPQQYNSNGGGFFGGLMADPIMGTLANIGAAYFGGPLGSAALQLAQGKNLEDAAKSAALTYAGQQVSSAFTDPNAVGGVYGPDNIDVGGGWSPATGATVAELAAARAALEVPTYTPEPVVPTVEAITQNIANAPDNIDIGGGWSPVPDVPDNIDAGGGWSPAAGATEAQMSAARAAMASTGWTFSQALDAIRAGLLVNSITGDPLGLSGSQGSQTDAPTGFSIVPVPTEWKPPEYQASSAPIDMSTIFSNQNMLGGTQWKNLPSQQNVSFNDIFAAGQQQTPIGTPVDINQIVSSILGQATTSQKPA